jgi:chloramphenicol-sensitive protein RarD
MNRGILYAVGAYAIWGLLPIYWKCLSAVPALQLVCHRIAWSFLFLVCVIGLSRRGKALVQAVKQPRVMAFYLVASALVAVNWLTYVWAVNSGFIVESSLGYFINPLFSVALGVVILRERLRQGQWLSIAVASLGVLYLTFVYGALPWIALVLAFTFGCYGLVKKMGPLGSTDGLALETALLSVPALVYLGHAENINQGAFLHIGLLENGLLIGAGLMTTIPLLLFAAAARRIPLSLMGMIQYIAPTLQFLIGVLVYKEPLSGSRLMGFGLVWLALLIFVIEGVVNQRSVTAKLKDSNRKERMP